MNRFRLRFLGLPSRVLQLMACQWRRVPPSMARLGAGSDLEQGLKTNSAPTTLNVLSTTTFGSEQALRFFVIPSPAAAPPKPSRAGADAKSTVAVAHKIKFSFAYGLVHGEEINRNENVTHPSDLRHALMAIFYFTTSEASKSATP